MGGLGHSTPEVSGIAPARESVREGETGMPDKEVILSAEGLRKLEDKLEHLKSVKRHEVAERIRKARQFGDINENSEYEDAKNEQAFVEGEVLQLEKVLRNAKLVDDVSIDPHIASLWSRVKIQDMGSRNGTFVEGKRP